jgi:hypothetical protein
MRGAQTNPKAKVTVMATATGTEEWTSGSLKSVKSRIQRDGPKAPHVASAQQARARPRSAPNKKEGKKPQISILRVTVTPVISTIPTAIGSQGLTAITVAHNRDTERSPAEFPTAVAP